MQMLQTGRMSGQKLSKKRQKTKDKRQKQAMDFLGQLLKTIKNYYKGLYLFLSRSARTIISQIYQIKQNTMDSVCSLIKRNNRSNEVR